MNTKWKYPLIPIALFFLSFNSNAQLNGTYTIGPTAPVYKTITQAVIALYKYGVLGPVTFNIEDGIYNEQVYVPFVNNASVTNLITFQPLSGDSTKVIIKFKPESDYMNYTLMLDGANFLVFKRLTFTTDTIFGRVVDIGNNCSFNQFINNRFIGLQESKELVYSQDTVTSIDNYNRFENNLFQYGSIGISMAGADNSNPEQGNDIFKNHFIDQSQKAIEIKYSFNFKVRSNSISSGLGLQDFTGIKILYCKDKFWVEKNKIDINNKSKTCHGISVVFSNGTTTANSSSISNNFIHIYSNEYVYVAGLEILGSFKNFYYNSVNLTGDNEASVCFFDIIASDINLVNNIFSNQAKGLAMTLNDTANITSDYNNLYSKGTDIINDGMNYYASISSWYASMKKDQHSVSRDPLFFSNTDLHTRNFRLARKGKIVAGVSDDIDGNARKSTKPDIGADEFNYKLDLGPDRYICAGSSLTLTAENGFDSYLWTEGDTTASITVDSSAVGLGSKKVKLTVTFEENSFTDSLLIHFIKPNASITPHKTVCEKVPFLLEATGGVKYLWSTGDTNFEASVTANKSSSFSVLVTDQYGCTDSDSIWINVKPSPATPAIILVGDDTLKSTASATSYRWFRNKNILSENTQSIKVSIDGIYQLIVYDSSCPSDTSPGYIFKKNSIEKFAGTEQFLYYPNPANSILYIETDDNNLSGKAIEIVSVLGYRVYFAENIKAKSEINLSNIPKGIYFLKLTSEGNSTVKRLIIR